MSKETIHEAFEIDLSRAETHEEAFKALSDCYSALVELGQPDANDKGRMRNIRLMTPKVGHAIILYHFLSQSKIGELLEQIEKLEQRKSIFQRVKEWFRRGK